MKTVVLKFGGTSLQTFDLRRKVITIIKERLEQNLFPVVVVSAFGRKGDPYATDSLLNLLPSNSSVRHKAMISACGEIISASIIAEQLKRNKIPAIALTGWQAGLLTNSHYQKAEVKLLDICNIEKELSRNIVPVICGFQGINKSGEITTLGRGGSDTTAAIIARAIKAKRLELFKDVDGVYTADPQLVKSARRIKSLSYHEISELAGNGAKIVHDPSIMELADKEIPIILGSTYSGKQGTCIQPKNKSRIINAVTSKRNLILITINISANERLSEIFNEFADHEISIDFINVDQYHVSFVIDESKASIAENILNILNLRNNMQSKFSKITAIGSGMTGRPGVMAKLSTALEANGIKIEMATDSYSTISFLVPEKFEILALNSIHKSFDL